MLEAFLDFCQLSITALLTGLVFIIPLIIPDIFKPVKHDKSKPPFDIGISDDIIEAILNSDSHAYDKLDILMRLVEDKIKNDPYKEKKVKEYFIYLLDKK